MEKSRLAVLLSVFMLLFILFSAADTDTGWFCDDTASCQADLGEEYYCSLQMGTCFLAEESGNATIVITPGSVAVVPITAVPAAPVAGSIEQRVAVLEASLTTVRNDLSALNADWSVAGRDFGSIRADLNSVQRQVAQISNDIDALSQEIGVLRSDLGPQVSQALAGFAVLQDNLNLTQAELNQVEEGLAKERAFTKFLTYTFFVLLAIAVMLGVAYYLLRSSSRLEPEILSYITKRIQQGKKYPDIKKELLKAGWNEEEVNWAYKETMKKNYQTYLQRKSASPPLSVLAAPAAAPSLSPQVAETATAAKPRTAPAAGRDKNKMISIAAISIFLLIGIFFLLSGVVGKAVFVERFVNTSSGEIRDVVSCTPPQILTPDKDACCTDTNNNTQCDTAEREVQLSSGACTDNLQCGSGKLCLNGACGILSEIYHGSEICDKQCNYYALQVVTSDGETYNVKPKRGSYTAAGALEWKIMEAPQHCNGEETVIPVSIVRKAPGKILSEEVITLQKGEASRTITHPALPGVSFSLKIESVNELCS